MLARGDLRLLKPDLVAWSLDVRAPLEDKNEPIAHIYFPETGIVSVVANGAHDREVEVGVIGREGMSGMAVVMGGDRSPHATYIQVAGDGLRLTAGALRRAMRKSPSLRTSFLNFAQAFTIQIAQTALANARANIDERLARWILMAHDRLDGDEVALTHEFLAIMLGVRRAGVTAAMQSLETRGLVETKRARLFVLNRGGLETAANGSYGIPEAEYRRLTGWKFRRPSRGRRPTKLNRIAS
jgi:CRP-like cAMP-binding protein